MRGSEVVKLDRCFSRRGEPWGVQIKMGCSLRCVFRKLPVMYLVQVNVCDHHRRVLEGPLIVIIPLIIRS